MHDRDGTGTAIAQWVSFGSSGLITTAERNEQRKTIKYNHLVANLLIFHTIVGMSNALNAIMADGHHDTISAEALTGLSPYQTEHINCFGDYVLDLNQPPAPLPFALPAQFQPSRMPSPASV